MKTQKGIASLAILAIIGVMIFAIITTFVADAPAPTSENNEEVVTQEKIDNKCTTIVCSTDSTCQNGICVKKDGATAQDACAWTFCGEPGTQCVKGKCVLIETTEETQGPYLCTAPCTGMPPSSNVVRECQTFTNETQCSTYKSSEFPFKCQWRPTSYNCPDYP